MSWTLALPTSLASSVSKPGDRFIPSRAGANWGLHFHSSCDSEKPQIKAPGTHKQKRGPIYSALLQNELLGAGIQKVQDLKVDYQTLQISASTKKNLFTFSPRTRCWRTGPRCEVSPYSLSPVSKKSQTLLVSTPKLTRKIASSPFKVLEAPDLLDDFYLNLLDWSCLNVITVGLGSDVYLWSATTSQVTKLCDLSLEDDFVTSVNWSEYGHLLAVGTQRGFVQIWDVDAEKKLSVLDGHIARVSSLAWNANQISSGSKDRKIFQRDIRAYPLQSQRCLKSHKQEVCGLRWSPDHQMLASGANDNRVLIWNDFSLKPLQQYACHKAAVKAIAWSPHQHGLLASGGGSTDCCIRFWNTLTGQSLQQIYTGSQVCNLAWSRQGNELVSTHGFSENQIVVWRYPSLTQVAKLTGHSYRVLYMAVSPDGQAIVTGAGDQSLRFWNIFRKIHSPKESVSALSLFTKIR